MIDITAQVQALLENLQEGLVVVYSPHTTAGITINENTDPDVKDIWDMAGDRHLARNSAAHLKASTVGASQTAIIHNAKLLLGRQGIF